MNIVYAGSDFIGIFEILESFQQFHLRVGSLDAHYVRIHVDNVFQDMVEFARIDVGL